VTADCVTGVAGASPAKPWEIADGAERLALALGASRRPPHPCTPEGATLTLPVCAMPSRGR